jgi:hypothetical protein
MGIMVGPVCGTLPGKDGQVKDLKILRKEFVRGDVSLEMSVFDLIH